MKMIKNNSKNNQHSLFTCFIICLPPLGYETLGELGLSVLFTAVPLVPRMVPDV